MKVLLINGSPNKKGCTYTALSEVAKELQAQSVETEIVHIGTGPIRGCIGCGKCRATNSGRCIFDDDIVNRLLDKVEKADGFVFGSPVYYASANGAMISVMDRLFYAGGKYFQYKPGAVVASARRAGTTTTYDQLNKYIGITRMLMVPAPYWNMVHGSNAEQVKQDEEGMWIMRTLGRNMAWLLNMLELNKQNNIPYPEEIPAVRTNFIR